MLKMNTGKAVGKSLFVCLILGF